MLSEISTLNYQTTGRALHQFGFILDFLPYESPDGSAIDLRVMVRIAEPGNGQFMDSFRTNSIPAEGT